MLNTKELAAAEWAIMQEFREFAKKHDHWEKDLWFLDPRNRDELMRSFAEWLSRPREIASNE